MGYRKGKASRRVKDWDWRFRADHASSTDAPDSETLLPRRVKLAAERFGGTSAETLAEAEAVAHAAGIHAEGMVRAIFPGAAYVRLSAPPRSAVDIGLEVFSAPPPPDLICALARTFRSFKGTTALVVGDMVTVELEPPGQSSANVGQDKQRVDGFIVGRQRRQTVLARPQPTSGKHRGQYDEDNFEKAIAANMDTLLIVAAVAQPKLRPGLIDRFCIVAERGLLRPVVVFNKIDLGEPDPEVLGDLRAGSVPTFAVSALTGAGMAELAAEIGPRRSVLTGPSGVGKSALVNALVPGAGVLTRPVRIKDDRGRHVTAAATVHDLPGGGLLVDTPGVRELALEMDENELPWYFPEFAILAPGCKFRDCSHTHEPDCAVRAAADSGALPARRYVSYLKILQTL